MSFKEYASKEYVQAQLTNIDAAPKTLYVTLNEDDTIASHSPTEIEAHIDNGGIVYLITYGNRLSLTGLADGIASFQYVNADVRANDEISLTEYSLNIYEDKTVKQRYGHSPLVSYVNGKRGRVNLTAEDVGALSADTIIPQVQIITWGADD